MRGQNLKAGPKLDAVNAGPKPDAVNAGSEPDVGPEPNAVNACSIRKGKRCKSKGQCWGRAQCSKCVLDKKVQEMQKQRSMLRKSAGHCKAVTLIFLAVLLCGARMGT
ncbi:hypothetical protein CDL15_Pgr012365 [Punica granatum]|uniref:Uncharacterized protein n=1 Tax=Punica granatum TaxID=22663 RepID=A0A218VUG9_PUNGR|nr:hypothetical protein CDL15_Pgr012365 [Punica granatum]